MNNISTTTCEIVGSSTQCITQQPEYFINGFSYGSIVIILFLLFIFTLEFFKTLKSWLLDNFLQK